MLGSMLRSPYSGNLPSMANPEHKSFVSKNPVQLYQFNSNKYNGTAKIIIIIIVIMTVNPKP